MRSYICFKHCPNTPQTHPKHAQLIAHCLLTVRSLGTHWDLIPAFAATNSNSEALGTRKLGLGRGLGNKSQNMLIMGAPRAPSGGVWCTRNTTFHVFGLSCFFVPPVLFGSIFCTIWGPYPNYTHFGGLGADF